jgi:glycosyltransferase involved in cell wall biosynthesis
MALQKRAIIFAARRASLVIALSNACKDILVVESIPASKIIVAPNGIDDYWRRFDIKDKNLSTLGINRKFILYVSNFHKYKNHYRLIEAYKNLPCELKNLFQLVLVGSSTDSSLHFKIRSYMQTHRLSNQILILPSQGKEVLKSLYQEASLFVFPSLVENCPNILLEAMASKCPVVTSNISPMPEFCGSAVRYFNPICSESIAREIEETLQDQELILKMKERSFEQVQELTWQSFFNIIKSQINRLSLG